MRRRNFFFPFLAAFPLLLLPAFLFSSALAAGQTPVKAKAPSVRDTTPPNKSLGSRSAPITVEVFSDYQCPACRLLYTETLRPLIDNYVATGKVYLVHRDFPLPMHQYSREAARLVNAAAKIGRFEKAESAVYAKRDAWEKDGNIEGALAAVLTPTELKQVHQIAQSGKMDPFIENDVALGNSRQVHQTPSVFVTHRGQLYPLPPGGVTYSLLKRFLDSLLEQ